MNITKKIIWILLIFFTSSNILFANTINSYIHITKENKIQFINYIKTKHQLEQIKNWNKYIEIIKKYISKIDNKQSKNLLKKLILIQNKLENKNDLKSKKLKIIINFIMANINLKIAWGNSLTEKKDTIVNNISNKDKEYIEWQILNLQSKIWNNFTNLINQFNKNINKINQYKKSGNLKSSLKIDYEKLWKINNQFNLNNYIIQKNNQDLRFNTNFELKANTTLTNSDKQTININWYLNLIKKDNLEYILVNKLKITDKKWFDFLNNYLEELKKIAKENKYIQISNKYWNTLQAINYSKIKNNLSKPLIESYNKIDNKYYLQLSKYWCDKLKEIKNTFDPIYWNKCSDSQYKDALDKINKIWKLYIKINNTSKKIVFIFNKTKEIDSWIISIEFNNKYIKNINIKIIQNQNISQNKWINLNYIYKNKLDFNINNDINFKSKLNYLNQFSNIILKANYKNLWELDLSYILNNNIINLNLNISKTSYNWDSWKYQTSNTLNIKFNWNSKNWKSNIILKDLNKNIDILKSNISLNNKILKWNTNIRDFNWENFISIIHSWKINKDNYELNNKYTINPKIFSQIKENNISWNINIKTINLNNYSNYNIFINTLLDNKEILNYNLNNKSKIIYKNINIEKPINIINNSNTIEEKNNNVFNIYTNQISKTRDTTRIYDLKSLQSAIEQYYMDNGEYPTTIKNNKWILAYISKIPQDPLKNFLWINSCKFGYIYQVWNDKNWIKNQIYKLSACLENTTKAKFDWWTDKNRFEIWIWINNDKNYYKKFYINWYKSWTKK